MQWDWLGTCGVEKNKNISIFAIPWEMHDASSSCLKEFTIVTNTLVASAFLSLGCFNVRTGNTFSSLRKATSTRAKVYGQTVALDATFSKATEHDAETLYKQGCRLFYAYVLIVREKQKKIIVSFVISYVRTHIL